MIGFFRSVAEAVVEKGVRGLVEDFVPDGKFVCDVAGRVIEKEKARRQRDRQRVEFEQILVLSHDQARAAAAEAFAAVLADRAEAIPAAELAPAVEWVAGIAEAARVSNRRADDPTGRTLSAAFALDTPDDVLMVLPPRPPRFRPGEAVPGRAGDWTLARVLGTGGFGEVWLTTHDDSYYAPRAVKFFFDDTGRDVVREADLVRRAMDAGRADDARAHIVPILDVRLKGDAPWLMFEYVGGGDLSGWVHELAGLGGAERAGRVADGLRQLCAGVGVFHGLPEPLAHRDLKPSNVLRDPATGRLRITDFGIGAVTQRAANGRESRGESTHGERLLSYPRGSHTPTYSSPQQRRGAPPDPRDDVHALGVIGYQLLVGKLDGGPGPRAAKQLASLGVPGGLAELVLDCASEELGDRPRDAMALRARLDALGGAKAASVIAVPTGARASNVTDAGFSPPISRAPAVGMKPNRPSLTRTPWRRLPSGIEVHDEKVGDGRAVQPGTRLKYHSISWFTDEQETVSCNTLESGKPFDLEWNALAEGLRDGMLGMKVGGVRVMRIPPARMFGSHEPEGLYGPHEPLVFRIELLDTR